MGEAAPPEPRVPRKGSTSSPFALTLTDPPSSKIDSHRRVTLLRLDDDPRQTIFPRSSRTHFHPP